MPNLWYNRVMLAQINYNNVNPCPIGNTTCVGAGGASNYLQNFITGNQGLMIMFTGLLFGMLLFYGIKLLLGSRSENIVTEVRQAYLHAFVGCVIVGGAFFLANTFASNTNQLVVEGAFNAVTSNVIQFIAGLIATLVLVNVVVQGIRLVVAMEDGDIDKARKGFISGMIGAGIAILAIPFVRVFTNVETAGGGGIIGVGIGEALLQLLGIGRYITLIFGALAVFGILAAGIMLVVSYDESLQDRARRLIIICLVALIICLAAFGIATLFINVNSPI